MADKDIETTEDSGNLGRKIGSWVIAGIVLLLIALFLGALLPRWWAQQIGDMVGGSITTGSIVGIIIGFVSTILPLLALMGAIKAREKRGLAIGMLIIGAILALPNLMTLWIVVGSSNSAHAGQRILDVNGPGFRGGTVIGVIAAALIFAAIAWMSISKANSERKLRKEKERTAARTSELAQEAEARRAAKEGKGK